MRTVHAVGALALGSALLAAPPAANASGEPLGGAACSMTATNDPTGVVFTDPTRFVGTVVAGPLVVGDLGDAFPLTVPPTGISIPGHPPSVTIGTLLCWVQLWGGYNYSAADYGFSTALFPGARAPGGGVLFGRSGVEPYNAPQTADQYLCGAVIDVDGAYFNDWVYDANYVDPNTGQTTGALVPADPIHPAACSLTISAG